MFTHPPPTTTFPFRFSAAIGVVSSPKLSVVSMSDGAADVSSVPPLSKTVRVEIKGRVQGVFFRYWTVENARELGLRGWVRNRRDGFVEAVFSGDPAAVQDMVDRRCRVGPPAAAVTGIASFPWVEDPGQDGCYICNRISIKTKGMRKIFCESASIAHFSHELVNIFISTSGIFIDHVTNVCMSEYAYILHLLMPTSASVHPSEFSVLQVLNNRISLDYRGVLTSLKELSKRRNKNKYPAFKIPQKAVRRVFQIFEL